MKKVNSPFRKSVTTLLAAVLMLTGTFLSCEKAPPVDPDTDVVSDSAVTDPSVNSSDMPVEEETAVEIKPDGTIVKEIDYFFSVQHLTMLYKLRIRDAFFLCNNNG